MKNIFLLTILVLGVFAPAFSHAQTDTQFQSEQEAKKHCPKDMVVWVNTKSGVYHFKGERWYGNTNEGAYECRKDVDGEGDRPTRNGQ
jgi:hypothetical protein